MTGPKHRGRTHQPWIALAAATTTALGLAACAPSQGQGQDESDGDSPTRLVVAQTGAPDMLDPAKAAAFTTIQMLELVYDSLLSVDGEGQLVPALASEWSTSEDGRTVTFALRPDVTFQNGEELTAEDAKATLERLLDEATASVVRSNLLAIDSIDATTDDALVLNLSRPDASLPYTLAMVQTAVMDTADLESGSYAQEPNGAGAFIFSEWQQGQQATLTSNPTYWAGQPDIDEVEFRVIPEESSVLAGLQADSFQVGLLTDPALVRQSADDEGLRVERVPSLNYHVLQLNGRKAPLDQLAVRQAIACAVDRQEVIDTAGDGEGVITGPITSPGFELDPTEGLPCEPGDVDAARQMLADAGYGDGLTLHTVVMTGAYATAVDEATNLQSQLAEIGVTLEIEQQPTNVYVQSWLNATYDAALALNSGDFSPYKMYASYYGESASYAAPAGLDSSRLQGLLAEANASPDREEQAQLYKQIQEELLRESPWVWLFRGNNYAVVQEEVQGVTIGPDNSLRSIRTATID